MTIAAVVTAAGLGTRLGADQPKALVPVAGQPLVWWAVSRVLEVAPDVVVTVPPDHQDAISHAVMTLTMARSDVSVRVTAGGVTRQESVALGVAEATRHGEPTVILVHDAARAFQPAAAMRAAIDAVAAGADGAVPLVPLVDTVVGAPEADGELGELVDRDVLRAVQTPQVFRAAALADAHARAAAEGFEATDDATLLRRYGYLVVATEGHPWGFKVTNPSDLALAEHVATLQ